MSDYLLVVYDNRFKKYLNHIIKNKTSNQEVMKEFIETYPSDFVIVNIIKL